MKKELMLKHLQNDILCSAILLKADEEVLEEFKNTEDIFHLDYLNDCIKVHKFELRFNSSLLKHFPKYTKTERDIIKARLKLNKILLRYEILKEKKRGKNV